jgi:hypothetical protein
MRSRFFMHVATIKSQECTYLALNLGPKDFGVCSGLDVYHNGETAVK